MMRPYDPADLAAERLKRGDQLRAMLEDLCSTFWASEWKGMGGHSSCDVFEHGFFRPLAHRPDLPAHQAVGNFAVLVLDHQDGGPHFPASKAQMRRSRISATSTSSSSPSAAEKKRTFGVFSVRTVSKDARAACDPTEIAQFMQPPHIV